jgi:glyoxylase-like metal-dependent hydrolase (beta-lactamase superfamily II)
MAPRTVVPGVAQLAHPASNAYLLDGGEGLVLVDTGVPGRAARIEAEIGRLRRAVGRDLSAIAITHAHTDHAGSLGRLADVFAVPVLVGELDAGAIRAGGLPPATTPTSRLGGILMRVAPRATIDAARVDLEVADGDPVPGAPGLLAIATPGHTPGHVSWLWPEHGGVLFAGDVAASVLGLRESFVHADRAQAARTLARLATLDFAVAVFGHGPPIHGRAVTHFRRLVEAQARTMAV